MRFGLCELHMHLSSISFSAHAHCTRRVRLRNARLSNNVTAYNDRAYSRKFQYALKDVRFIKIAKFETMTDDERPSLVSSRRVRV